QKQFARLREAETKLKILLNRIKEAEAEILELLVGVGLKKDNGTGVKVDASAVAAFIEDQKKSITDAIETLRSGELSAVTKILGVSETELLFKNYNDL